MALNMNLFRLKGMNVLKILPIQHVLDSIASPDKIKDCRVKKFWYSFSLIIATISVAFYRCRPDILRTRQKASEIYTLRNDT